MARGGEQPGELWDTLQDALMGALGPEQSPALLSAGIQRAPLAGDCLVPPWSCASRSCDEAPAMQPLQREHGWASVQPREATCSAVLPGTPLLGTQFCLHSPRGTALMRSVLRLKGCAAAPAPFGGPLIPSKHPELLENGANSCRTLGKAGEVQRPRGRQGAAAESPASAQPAAETVLRVGTGRSGGTDPPGDRGAPRARGRSWNSARRGASRPRQLRARQVACGARG